MGIVAEAGGLACPCVACPGVACHNGSLGKAGKLDAWRGTSLMTCRFTVPDRVLLVDDRSGPSSIITVDIPFSGQETKVVKTGLRATCPSPGSVSEEARGTGMAIELVSPYPREFPFVSMIPPLTCVTSRIVIWPEHYQDMSKLDS